MKKAFTLIEVMISVVIFSILILFMSKVVDSLNSSIQSLKTKQLSNIKQKQLTKALYADILEAKTIKIYNKNKNYSVLYIQTANSLYNIAMPYVVWYVSKKDKALMRLESATNIELPVNDGYLDIFQKGVKIFKIYNNKDKYFVFIKAKKDIFFEF